MRKVIDVKKSLMIFALILTVTSSVLSQTSAAEAALGFIYLNIPFFPESRELARNFEKFNFAEIVEKFQTRVDDESLFFVGMSWFHLLNYDKAKSFLAKVKGARYGEIASYILDRIEIVLRKDWKAYERCTKSIERLNNTMARSERAFLRSLIEGKPALSELEGAYRDAIKEYDVGRLNFVDIHAFNYILFLKDQNPRQAHIELNKVVRYDFTLSQETLYYDARDLRELSFSIVRLLSEVLYLRAAALLESMFGMTLSTFLNLNDRTRSELILRLYTNDKGNYNALLYFLDSSLNVVILGVNNYYFVQSVKEPNTFFTQSTYDLHETVRRILMYVKLS